MSKSFRSARSPDTSAGAFDSRPARLARRPFPNPDSERRELTRRSSAGVDASRSVQTDRQPLLQTPERVSGVSRFARPAR